MQIEAVDIVGPAAAVAEVGDVFLHTGENDTCHIIPRTQGQSGGSRDAPDRDLGAVDIGKGAGVFNAAHVLHGRNCKPLRLQELHVFSAEGVRSDGERCG